MSASGQRARPLVSIGVPTYNRVHLLERSIVPMLAQDYGNVEIVISDNASNDGTRQFCEELARKDPRVSYYRQPHNVGPVKNYGEVLRFARGDLYMNMADDDVLDPSYVSKCVAELEADSRLLVVAGRALMYADGALHHESIETNLLDESPEKRVLSYYETVTDNGAFHGVVRRSVVAALPPMPAVLGGDWLFMASLAFRGRIKTVTDTSIVKHMGGTSASLVNIARVLGLSPWRGRYGIENIMIGVFCDIAWESPVYAGLGQAGRLRLATSTLAVLVKRFGRYWKSRYFLRMVLNDLLPADLKRRLLTLRALIRSL